MTPRADQHDPEPPSAPTNKRSVSFADSRLIRSRLESLDPRWCFEANLDGAGKGVQLIDYGWRSFYVKCR
jgi:hypothetical protein